jgi:Dirigent-like protein
LAVIAMAAAATASLSWAASSSAMKVHKQVRYVRTVATSGYYVDNDPSGSSGGDLFGSTGDLRHAGHSVGTFSSACTASSAERAECQATFSWNDGARLQLAGDIQPQASENQLAIVGGTGKYKKARGDATLKRVTQDGSVQKVKLRILR